MMREQSLQKQHVGLRDQPPATDNERDYWQPSGRALLTKELQAKGAWCLSFLSFGPEDPSPFQISLSTSLQCLLHHLVLLVHPLPAPLQESHLPFLLLFLFFARAVAVPSRTLLVWLILFPLTRCPTLSSTLLSSFSCFRPLWWSSTPSSAHFLHLHMAPAAGVFPSSVLQG